MMAETSHLKGARIVPKMSIRYPYSSGRRAAFSIRLNSQVLVRVVQHNNSGGVAVGPLPVPGGDMVHSAGIPWVASCQALRGKPASLDGAVHRDCFKRIGRAAGEEAANLSVQRRDHLAVGHQQEDQDVPR